MRAAAVALGSGILALAASLLVGSAAAGAAEPRGGALPPGIEQALAAREYQASANAQGLQAPNRAHGLRTYFEPTGIRVHDRTAPGSPELFSLTLSGVGRGDALARVVPGQVTQASARVEIQRPGLLEWYENSAAGLEQGFRLARRPAGAGELRLELALSNATASGAGGEFVFLTAGGRRLGYGALQVRDAAGRRLAARFEQPSSARVQIVVDDAGATYPVVVDPLLTAVPDATLESNQDNANLGRHVASAGDVNGDGYADVIVGAPFYDDGENDEGAAFVFHGGPGGVASGGPLVAAAKIASDQALANLGQVAGAGDVNGDGYDDVIVGAVGYDAGEGFREGAAFVFHGGPSGVGDGSPANADATLESNQGDAWFGIGVAGAGDVNGDGYADVIVGAHQYGTDEGAAFVFHGSASGIADGNPSTADTSLVSAQAGGQFGASVASAGDVNGDGYADVIVGAEYYDNPQGNEGAAFIYLGGASGIADGGPGTANTLLEGGLHNFTLGWSVASAGDVNGDGYADVIVGTDDWSFSGGFGAYVFHGSGSGIPSGTAASANGSIDPNGGAVSVASAGDVNGDGYADVIVGASLYDAGTTDEGAFFVLLGSASGIGSQTPATAWATDSSAVFQGLLGISVAGAGDVNGDGYADIVAGATGYDGGNTDEGAAFVYYGGAQGIVNGSFSNTTTVGARFESNQANAKLGWSVASAGDVNGDGYGDVIVGAPAYDAGDEGAAFVFLGGASGTGNGDPTTADAQLVTLQAGAGLGYSVASAGDVNGDGYGDVIVGAYQYTNGAGEDSEGAAFVFHGGPSGIGNGDVATAATRLEANQLGAQLGFSVASAGDVNGDGYGDVIVGAPLYDDGQSDEGAAFVFLGGATGIPNGSPATAAAKLESDQADARLGWSVSSAGDVNGDGYADVIVGARYYDDGETDEGAAFVFHGGASGIANGNPATAAARLESDEAGAQLISVASAGDVNGDGRADVIVGAYRYGSSDGGGAFVFLGGASGVGDGNPGSADTRIEGIQPVALLGSSVASAGDVNGDGYADVIVGANYYDNPDADEGAAFVFLGSAAGIPDADPATAAAQLESDQPASDFGFSVSSAGDVNGDGFADVLVGAQTLDVGETDEGAAFVFYGNGNRTGRSVLSRQLHAGSGNRLVQPWGFALSPTATQFRVRMQATHPAGRGRVKLEIQACPAGVPFGHASCLAYTGASWTDVSSGAGVTLTETFPGGTFIRRWRARVLYAPSSVTQPGITAPPAPGHGPWRRLLGQAFGSDLRPLMDTDSDGVPDSSDSDIDGDGLLNAYETNTGTYVSPTDTGTNPLDPDSDDDGLLDGAEVALGTSPVEADTDHDGVCDGNLPVGPCTTPGPDNCPLIVNPGQQNSDAYDAGDACQCGDVTGDGPVSASDYKRAREHVAGGTPSGPFDVDRCDVTGDGNCDVEDLAVLDRLTNGAPALLVDRCAAYTGP